ncbi:hypothetical protein A3D77_07165 [Candidatus Gottesmanbacteria bacterium RIFCSPHIGHO2_02_FULL_39_11]|uniref:Membrane protein 6-pyruvoyl-tetrahydropterin synthase-related domain-containing protein n=1 Tax=Candidatus Gottesmanbacteria bacterium RIFCSPHIGHO2_02_FULL_39_11 TaxID=1798382 RepID=A0A1F5ZK06_9BACT|nr:MAG: hypothetical protein A3D77_07165 [Candidatus Gottesmanbacteria bacterium RIFCSPHIGHO2_02_FULL_39_11]
MKKLSSFFTDRKIFLFLVGLGGIFFYPFFIFGKIPIPSDALVGLYYPFRDTLNTRYPNGYPYKNPLITDPVRQQYVWRELSVDAFRKGKLPLWNPYSFAGTPLLANFQSASFYPLNILFFIFSFPFAWGILVSLQPTLSLIFMYFYLRELKITKAASVVGSLAFSFSGFSISWLTWNTVGHTVLWLPLILLSGEKIIKNTSLKWSLVLLFSLCSSFFAGHLQTFFYIGVFSLIYFVAKLINGIRHPGFIYPENPYDVRKKLIVFFIFVILFTAITSVQWIPTLGFISQSARNADQANWQKEGWFVPPQNLLQFFAPDFFGNPATGNYYGVWNYGEFIGYIGMIPLFFALYAALKLKDKKSIFFVSIIMVSIVLITDNPVSEIPYRLNIPYIGTSQPTRLMSLIDFSLAVLASLGVDQLRSNTKQKRSVLFSIAIILMLLGIWTFSRNPVARNNLYLSIFLGLIIILTTQAYRIRPSKIVLPVYLLVTVFDLFRFGWKFTPFTSTDLLYPQSSLLSYLEDNSHNYRVMANDRRILPPNVSSHYKIQDVSGYDPLYLLSYNKFVSSWNSNSLNLKPSAFNRIVTPQNYESPVSDLLGIKYLLSLTPVQSLKWEYVMRDGETYLYQNKDVLPRAYLAQTVFQKETDQDVMREVLNNKNSDSAFSTENITLGSKSLTPSESAVIENYEENDIRIKVISGDTRMLVLTDPYYKTWKAFVDEKETQIFKVNFLFRGVVIPSGEHIIEFKNYLF